MPAPDPRLALFLFAVASLLVAIALWPRSGILARIRRLRQLSERVRIEDTLKYIFHRNTDGEGVHADALAGALELRRGLARRILGRLAERGLATSDSHGAHLTENGRREAIRIVRTHRLLESYFADRTGVSPAEWHELAEAGEHELSSAEADQLAARLGQPRYDPHGDPIPTAAGELPEPKGIPVAALAEGETGTIVHLEDEPPEDYARLAALGFKLGRAVVRRGRTNDGVALEFEGRILDLPLELTDSVNVVRGALETPVRPRTLADLGKGERATVVRLSSECRGAQRRRLLDLGVVPGTEISSELRSATGDPTAYEIRGALIALRRHQAEWIEVEPNVSSPEVAA